MKLLQTLFSITAQVLLEVFNHERALVTFFNIL
jgi:hypothetical protein